MKALVYRMGGLGDSLLVYPILEILSRKGYDVTVWGNPEYFSLAEQAGFCKKATFYEPKEEFDLKVIFSRNSEILNSHGSIYINPVPAEQIWIVDYYLEKLEFQNEGFSKTLPVEFSRTKNGKLCIVHPGSGSKKKNPDINFFFELEEFLSKYAFDIVYLVGPAERELAKEFKNAVYVENPVEAAKILLRANLYIGVDSGISHLSSYLGVPSIIIFGPTDPTVWHPIGDNFIIIRYESCQACFPNVCEERKCLEAEFLLNKIKALQIYQKA